ncbi:EF-hand domain-containing protein [Pontiellaceae bacterium B1224]|nr:EF-hand domain-containing protein [Pontiellaceae bacterium B1224]
MKKWLVIALVACVAAGVQAAEETTDDSARKKVKNTSITKDQFMKKMKADVEKVGDVFDPAKANAEFKKLDKDGDGKLTGAEMPKKKGKVTANDEGKAKDQDETAPAAPTETKKREQKPVTKEIYVANQKKMAERKGVDFDQTAAEAKFTKMDKNKDGTLTADEMPKRKPKAKAKAEETATDSDE